MQISDRTKEHLRFLADTLTPGPYRCYLCGTETQIGDDGLCEDCRSKLQYLPNPTYLQPLDGLTVGLKYSPEIASAVMRFKKNGQTEYASFFTQFLSVPDEWHVDILIPVPMHPLKEYLRGFNHSAMLCSYLSQATQIPFTTKLLHKVRLTGEQKRQENAAERRRNIRGSFKADPHVQGLRIALIDDVFTTGATVYECAKALKQEGADKVFLAAVTAPDR